MPYEATDISASIFNHVASLLIIYYVGGRLLGSGYGGGHPPRSAVRPEGCPGSVCSGAAIRNPFGTFIACQLIKLGVEPR
jgi:hypothetical protein